MTIREAVREAFDNAKWEYAEKDGWFELSFDIDAAIGSALVQVDTNDGVLVIMAALDHTIPETASSSVTAYANTLNMISVLGCWYLDTEEHVLVFKFGSFYGEASASPDDVQERLYLCLKLCEHAANVLPRLTEGSISADDAALETLQQLEE